jgi:hypothetical protein
VRRYAYSIPTGQARLALEVGILRRDQLGTLGLTESFARNEVRASRWTQWGDHVLLMQNAPPSRQQLMWIALMDAGPFAVLGSHTALELLGFRSWAQEAEDVHLIISRGARSAQLPGVRVHESRRMTRSPVVTVAGLPCTTEAYAAVDAAAWQPFPRFACALLASVVQQRLCTPGELDEALAHVGRVRHKAYMRLALRDIALGAHAAGELEVAKMCRRFGLEQPDRQGPRVDSTGQLRYLDSEWELPTGEIVVLEVDGRHHLAVEHWQADMRRERAVVILGRRVLRATNLEVRLEPAAIARDLVAIGVPCTTPTCQREPSL